jgi:non-canonical poly(A) RNA polymerase PAPD5/7
MLKLRDPADETNDLGRRIVAWKHIQATFKYQNRRLHKDLEVNERASLLATFLRVVYNTDERTLRKQLSSYGLSLSEAGAMPDDVYAMSGETLSADHGELDDIAQSIKKYRGPIRKVPFQKGPVADAEAVSRAYEEAKKQPAADIEAAMEAAKTDDVQGINTWLKDIEEASEHKQTGDAFANILGLNKKADK